MKINESLEESGLQVKRISETIKNEINKQKGRFFTMLLGAVAATILGIVVDHFQKTKKEYKNLKKQEIHDIFMKTN